MRCDQGEAPVLPPKRALYKSRIEVILSINKTGGMSILPVIKRLLKIFKKMSENNITRTAFSALDNESHSNMLITNFL